jgi:hypothetical protein
MPGVFYRHTSGISSGLVIERDLNENFPKLKQAAFTFVFHSGNLGFATPWSV